jgi:hypothetical protein
LAENVEHLKQGGCETGAKPRLSFLRQHSNADRIVGLLKDIDIDSVDLQHATGDVWVRKIVSD